MKKYKVCYSLFKESEKETIISEKYGLPYINEITHKNVVYDGYEDIGFDTYEDAKNRADILAKITNRKYININIKEYNE